MGKDELRAHVVVDGKLVQVPFEESLASRPAKAPGTYGAVTEKQADAAWKKASEARMKSLAAIVEGSTTTTTTTTSAVTPEDGSVRIAAYHMGFGASDFASERFIEQMADIGRVEGFRVVARVSAGAEKYLKKLLGAEEERNVTFVKAETYHDIWSEDAGEVRRDRSVGVPTVMPAGMDAPIEILKARYERATGKKAPNTTDAGKVYEALKKDAPDECYAVLGQVFAQQAQKSMCALAVSANVPLRVSCSAIEGGNLVVGTDKTGNTCAFVGRDSWELSRRVIAKDLGVPLSKIDDATLKRVIAHDLGLPASSVHCISQPSDYHLDVKMLPIAPGEMIVNDSIAAAERQIEWLREDHANKKPVRGKTRDYEFALDMWKDAEKNLPKRIDDIRTIAKFYAKGEAQAQKDLEQAGMTVHRMAAVYMPVGQFGAMNFLNAEQGRGKDGERFLVALGGDPRGEKAFLKDVRKALGSADDASHAIARFYFLDRKLTPNTLQAGGGVNCRCKPEAAQP